MNERIKEPYYSLMYKDSQGWNDHLFQIPPELLEKFAESIVRECMKVAGPNYISTPEDSVYYVEEAIGRIAKHFGVKE